MKKEVSWNCLNSFNPLLWRFICFLIVVIGARAESLAQNSTPLKQIDVVFGKGEFDSAAKQYANLAKSSTAKKEVYIQALVTEALSKINLGKQGKVFELLKEAELTAAELDQLSQVVQARLNIVLGKYHLVYKEYDLAVPLLDEGHEISQKVGADLSAPMHIELNKSLGDLYYDRADYPKALEYYNQAIAVAEEQPHEEVNYKQLADMKILAGEVYDKVLEPNEAIDRYQKVLSQKDTLLKDDPERAGELYYRLGGVYFRRKDYDAAEIYLDKALKYDLTEGENSDAKFMLSTIYFDREKYDLALILNGSALNSWSPQKNKLPEENFKAFLQFGKLSSKQTNSVQAKASYKKMTQRNEGWSLEEELTNIKEEKITYLPEPNLSDNHNISLLSYHESSLVIPELKPNKQVIAEIDVQMAKGALFFKTKNYARAKGHFEKALGLMKTIYAKKHPMVVEASRSLSEVYLEEKIYGEAMGFIDKALEACLEEGQPFNPNDVPAIDQAKFPLELLYAIGTKGKVLKGLYSKNKDTKTLVQALAMFDATIKLLNKLRRTYRKEGSKYQLARLAQEFSEQAALVCYELHLATQEERYLHRAFDYVEIAKGSLLLEALRDLKARKIANIPDSIIQKENQQKIEIAYLKGEIYYEIKQGKYKDIERLVALEKQLKDITKVHEKLVVFLEKKYPKYFDLKYNYSTASISDIQQVLKEEEMMVDYLMLDSAILVFTIDQTTAVCHLVPHNIGLTNVRIAKFLKAIRKNEMQELVYNGNSLYELLITPLSNRILNKDLIVIPDGLLNNIPFGILPMAGKDDLQYMNEAYAFCYNYSATIYLASQDLLIHSNIPKKIIGFAPDFGLIDSMLNQNEDYSKVVGELGLEPLTYAAQEVKVLEQLFTQNSLGVVGGQATETFFKETANQYGVLHFATHGIVNHSDPMFSSLAFITDDKNDGLLHTHELFGLELNAELVTLSACNSGVGKLYAGEGVMSIARGFAYSGAPNMIMTLWPVSDQATQVIMEGFYQHLKNGLPKHKALQQAKLDFIREYRLETRTPQLWGGLIVVGNTDEVACLVEENSSLWWLWIAVGSFAFLVAFFFWKRNKKHKL
ncbi:CHAT domain-containing protein [Aureispira anguillae]|uniref:CHAT domain-containing protein n=1 Tax=Aureispira anguillae TaxID=2864201 RepID=A0A916DWE4_9BACT|nr:CHAT domain-containing protein [Aureispira anguillae]BDS15381.1 CHAT domain-containing protein [Aureispira anguillae]